jgi:hypothetical protein
MIVYVDLDGLLADLFGAISTRFFNKPYNELTVEEKNQAKKIWYDREHFVDNFGNVEEFFANLKPFGKNGELTKAIIDTVVKEAGGYSICSHPASIDSKASEAGKRIWIHKHLNPLPDEMYFPQNKAEYALSEDGSPNVLIDDFPPYVAAWRNKGGIAIEMRTDSFNSVEQVKSYITKELDKARKQLDGQVKESFDSIVGRLLSEFNA